MVDTTSMRAAVVRAHGGPEATAFDPAYPRPQVKPGCVLLRVRACSLNHHDIVTRRSMPGIKVPLPIIIGSDIAGEIAEIGAGVNGFAIGERVLIDPLPLSGEGAPKIVVKPSRR